MTRRVGKRRYVVGVALAGAALIGAVWFFWATPRYTVTVTSGAQVVVRRRSAVDERPPTVESKRAYTVPSDAPRYLRIGKLGIEARVLALGRSEDGEIAAPPGIWDVAWYTGSAKPGQSGVTFIDGHISGPSLPAVFKDLHMLAIDDMVSIERGDGSQLDYRVRSVQIKPVESIDMRRLLTEKVDDNSTLILMTCGGDFNARQYSYNQRVVVMASRL